MDFINTKTVRSGKAIRWLDYDKGITILLVGYGHAISEMTGTVSDLHSYPTLTYIATFLYGFRMPLFFIVSGILVSGNLKKKGLSKYAMTRADLLYGMMIWGVIEISLKLISHSEAVTYWSYLDLLINPRETGHFWYLNALCCIGILYSFVKTKLKPRQGFQIATGLLFYTASSYGLVKGIRVGFLTDVGRYYIFFALGDTISAYIRDEKKQGQLATWKLFIPLFIGFFCLQYYCTFLNLQHADYGQTFVEQKLPALYLAEALVGCATSMSLSFLLQKYNVCRWLTVVGYYSLFIYLMQMIVMSVARTFLQHQHLVSIPTPVLVLSIWVIGTLLPIAIYQVLMRCGFWWLYSFRKPAIPIKVKILQVPARFKRKSRESSN